MELRRLLFVALGTVAASCTEVKPTAEAIEPTRAPILSTQSAQRWAGYLDGRCGAPHPTPWQPWVLPETWPPGGLPEDFGGAEVLIRRTVAEALTTRYVPYPHTRIWNVVERLGEQRRTLVPELRALAGHEFSPFDRGVWAYPAWRHLAELGDMETLALLRARLRDDADWMDQAAAADAVALYGAAAAHLEPELTRLVTHPWSPFVRGNASYALARIRGEAAQKPNAQALSRELPRHRAAVVSGKIWIDGTGFSGRMFSHRYARPAVELDGVFVEFDSGEATRPTLPDALENLRLEERFSEIEGIRQWRSGLSVVRPLAGGWLVGTALGEFGGDAWWVDPAGVPRLLVHANILGAVEFGGELYLAEGLAHMEDLDGSLMRVRESAHGVSVEHAFRFPMAPYTVHVEDDRLYVDGPYGVGVLDRDFGFSLHPPSIRRTPPQPVSQDYMDRVDASLAKYDDDVDVCLAPIREVEHRCDPRVAPVGVSMWLEVGLAGVIDAGVLHRFDDPFSRPAIPEVEACLRRAAKAWLLPTPPEGWVLFGFVFDRS